MFSITSRRFGLPANCFTCWPTVQVVLVQKALYRNTMSLTAKDKTHSVVVGRKLNIGSGPAYKLLDCVRQNVILFYTNFDFREMLLF